MENLDQMKNKYQPVLDAINREGGQLQNLNMDGDKLFIKAAMPSEQAKDRVWDAIKSVDPNYSDLKHEIEVKEDASQGTQTSTAGAQAYTVQPGDNLWKISKKFYGDANQYARIAAANKIDDPDKIKSGQQLIIPAA